MLRRVRPNRRRAWATSGRHCLLRHELIGQPDDLDGAIGAYRQTIELTAKPSAEQEINLADALERRFARLGDIDDLNEAIERYRQAVARVSLFSALLAPALSSLGQALKTRYDHSAVIDDLDEAIEHHRQAIQITSAGAQERAGRFYRLALALPRSVRRLDPVERS